MLFLLTGLSCCKFPESPSSAKHSIQLEVVRQSSDILECKEIIGYSLKKLEEENEILIQVGIVDTNSDIPPKTAAVIKLNGIQIFLYKDTSNTNPPKTDIYSGDDYKLTLIYRYDDNVSCIIQNKTLKSQYELKTRPNGENY